MAYSLKEFGLQVLEIPDELKIGTMWAVSTMKIIDAATGKRDKAPRNPYTGKMLSVTNPEGWVTFDEAVSSGYPAVGMLLTAENPYVVIDLDKSSNTEANLFAKRVVETFDSYTEKSTSGQGVHIILKGDSGVGLRRNNVEIYSQERYIICTGDRIKNLPITDGGEPLENLKSALRPEEYNPEAQYLPDSLDMVQTDQQVLVKMFSAVNGESIKSLYESRPKHNEDWSLKDAQLAQHIAFYTRNHEQALRLFRGSALYRGDGSKRGYENIDRYENEYLLRRTFARAWANEDARLEEKKMSDEEFKKVLEQTQKEAREKQGTFDETKYQTGNSESKLEQISVPPGLVGEIARYIYESAPRPVWEVAIAGALSFVSGLCGRHYNINGSGLGLYIILMAKTGRGKEAANSGISVLMAEVYKNMPSIMMFRGPSHIASGQGLIRCMADAGEEDNIPSKVIMLSEFGHTLRIITSRDATSAEMRTRQALLDLFSKNSWGSVVKESAYADKTNNTKDIFSPNVSLFGDTTPEVFFKSVNMDILDEGFLPRFLIVEYDGPRVKSNYDRNRTPPLDLVTRVTTLATQVISLRDKQICINITMTDEAKEILNNFDDLCDSMINSDTPTSEIWNRAHLKALRVCGTLAVGDNMFNPVVTGEMAKWAVNLILRDVKSIELRLAEGAYGGSDMQKQHTVREQLDTYLRQTTDQRINNRCRKEYAEQGLIPHSYLVYTCCRKSIFQNDSVGPIRSLDYVIQCLINQGDLEELSTVTMKYDKSRSQFLRVERIFRIADGFKTNYSSELKDMDEEMKMREGVTRNG